MTSTGFLTGRRQAYDLEEGRILRLCHKLFDDDSIFWSNVCREVTLRSDKSARFVRFLFPDMPYMGIWHAPKSDAPYVCIEPWCGLPAYDGGIDDFERKSDMFRLQAGGEKTVEYTLIFG
jgi:galactose mutarotase-like enzyme